MEKIKAKDLLNPYIEVIDGEATVLDAIEKLVEKRIRSLLVKMKEEYGVITIRNIMFKVISQNIPPEKIKVKDIASTPLFTVEKETPLSEIISLMKEHNVARIFVKENGKIIGVISFMDILRFVLIEKAKNILFEF